MFLGLELRGRSWLARKRVPAFHSWVRKCGDSADLQRMRKSQNVLSWKRPTGVIDPAPGAAQTPKNPTLGIVQTLLELRQPWFDIYRKVPKDLTQPTYTGAIISVCCCLFILFLFLSELSGFIATEIVNELYVDDPDKDSGGKIEVNLNISLPNLHCELVGLDIQDEMGRHEVGHIDNSMKIPLNNGDGCRFEGHFSINKVPGNFHVSTHSATAQPQNPDMTHVIHKLSFGDKLQVHNVHGAFNALEGADKLSSNPLASHDYILKIVPTVYEDMSGKQRYSYQYTVANKEYVAYSHTGRIIPAIWFRYDLSPITVKYTERRQPLYRFITSICAIIGGTFTVAGILDSCIFTASEAWKKIQLGKMQ
ncbi:endoplasmic reticulum-Golgi intermediate compartment protein 1 isoform 6-T10 [Sylvia borin]